MKKIIFALSLLVLSACQSQNKKSDGPLFSDVNGLETQNGRFSVATEAQVQEAQVVLIPQWHFSPQVDTRRQNFKQPQFENQFAIFKQLELLKDRSVWVVEGCEGEITKGFGPAFNGWGLKDVEAELKRDGNIDLVMTHIGLKGEALYQDKLRVVCGDSNKLVKEHLTALSDIRGLVGYRLRIDQLRNEPSRRASYIESVQGSLKISKGTSDAETMRRLDDAIRQSIVRYKALVNERNEFFVKSIVSTKEKSAVIIGALHIEDLEKRMKKANIKYVLFVPKGLEAAGGDPIIALEKLLGI
jgi:hypothetical protein